MEYQVNYQMNENVKGMSFSCWKYNQEEDYIYPLHCHSYYEISFVTKGKREEYYNHNYYNAKQGRMFFFSPLSVHGFKNSTPVSDMILQFSPEFLSANIPTLKKNEVVVLNTDKVADKEPCIDVAECAEIQDILKKFDILCYSMEDENAAKFESDSIRNLKTAKLLLELLDVMFEKGYLKIEKSQNDYLGFPQVETVINKVLSDPCNIPTLQEAADLVNVSYYHFSRLFKKTMGINYLEYCNILRICHAEELLAGSDKSISEIAFEIGYESNTSFVKSFKKYHNITPSKYRDRLKER
ncbi:MAG: AraC family transcriptional regulator [Lachnospiraceae bacterium]|nr:AraC family transcriptional regulator [Lachnospiraceae bacterium]